MITFVILGVLVLLILLGVPVAVSLGLTAVGFYVLQDDLRILTMLPQRMFSATTGFTLLAIPFFILAGNLMNTGGITRRIFRFANACVGHIRGGLGQVNVLASLVFSGMSGAAVADAVGLGESRGAAALRALVAVLSLAFLTAMTAYGWELTVKSKALTPILDIPTCYFFIAIPVSGAVMFAYSLGHFFGATVELFSKE